jgi:hypothetical protein
MNYVMDDFRPSILAESSSPRLTSTLPCTFPLSTTSSRALPSLRLYCIFLM